MTDNRQKLAAQTHTIEVTDEGPAQVIARYAHTDGFYRDNHDTNTPIEGLETVMFTASDDS